MGAYREIEQVKADPEFGNSGPPGWAIMLWSEPDYSEPHRPLLERFAKQYPECALNLPEHYPEEDCVEGSMTWQSQTISIWYEEILTHLRLWSDNRDAVQSLRAALLPLAQDA
jgi:hypothetical protein